MAWTHDVHPKDIKAHRVKRVQNWARWGSYAQPARRDRLGLYGKNGAAALIGVDLPNLLTQKQGALKLASNSAEKAVFQPKNSNAKKRIPCHAPIAIFFRVAPGTYYCARLNVVRCNSISTRQPANARRNQSVNTKRSVLDNRHSPASVVPACLLHNNPHVDVLSRGNSDCSYKRKTELRYAYRCQRIHV